MHSPIEDDTLALKERSPKRETNDELRSQEEDILHFEGSGFTPGLTKAYRAPRIVRHLAAST